LTIIETPKAPRPLGLDATWIQNVCRSIEQALAAFFSLKLPQSKSPPCIALNRSAIGSFNPCNMKRSASIAINTLV